MKYLRNDTIHFGLYGPEYIRPRTRIGIQIRQPRGEEEMNIRVLWGLCTAVALPGCAAIFDGTTQQISVNTTPPAASCKFMRLGAPIAEISSTPGAATIQKTKHDITIVCNKTGFTEATYVNHSGVAGAAFANILGVVC